MLHAPNIMGEGAVCSAFPGPSPRAFAWRRRTIHHHGIDGGHGNRPHARLRHFANTGWEPRAVYDQLAWLMSPNVPPFPVHIVSAGNIREQLIAAGQGDRCAAIPAFAKSRHAGRREGSHPR